MTNAVDDKRVAGRRPRPLRPRRCAVPGIEVRSLNKSFGSVHALRDVNFVVEQGEIFGYLGRNAAGKTTTVRILPTLTRKTSGLAFVHVHEVERDQTAIRNLI